MEKTDFFSKIRIQTCRFNSTHVTRLETEVKKKRSNNIVPTTILNIHSEELGSILYRHRIKKKKKKRI